MTAEQKILNDILKSKGYSVTKPRLELFNALQRPIAPTSIELVKTLTNRQDQATVYRNLDLFKRLGVVQYIQLGSRQRIKLSSRFVHHHHHLRCTNCQLVIRLPENEKLEQFLLNEGKRRNFTELDHHVEITGLCATCRV